jgi:hypothetical protein
MAKAGWPPIGRLSKLIALADALTICATGVGFAPIPRCIADQWGLGVCSHRNSVAPATGE